MKSLLVYFFFIVLTFALFSVEAEDKAAVGVELTTSQFLNEDGIVPEILLSKNSNLSKLIISRFIIGKHLERSIHLISKPTETSNRCYQVKAIDIIPLKQKPFRQIRLYTTENQENNHLS
ncbi:MAG: hypothetical protein JEZ03_01690 [Bacteroidales bacterium]|nr:hypothetical protein [Bacteroidales bacterium]